jgi:hypothetical protein
MKTEIYLTVRTEDNNSYLFIKGIKLQSNSPQKSFKENTEAAETALAFKFNE